LLQFAKYKVVVIVNPGAVLEPALRGTSGRTRGVQGEEWAINGIKFVGHVFKYAVFDLKLTYVLNLIPGVQLY